MLSTFLLQLGAGCLFGVLPVPAAATGRAFNRFVAGLAAGILILGVGAAVYRGGAWRARPVWALAATAALAASTLAHLGRLRAFRLPLLLAATCSLIGLSLDAADLARAGGRAGSMVLARHVLDALGSAWLLGSILIAMILGHYYLNIAGLPLRHLVRLCLIAMAAVAVRSASAAWGLAAGGGDILRPWLAGSFGSGDMLALIVLLQRVLFGLAGEALLTTMAWRTARIGSTQSATGILYIAVVAALVGEIASRYLLFGTGHPI